MTKYIHSASAMYHIHDFAVKSMYHASIGIAEIKYMSARTPMYAVGDVPIMLPVWNAC